MQNNVITADVEVNSKLEHYLEHLYLVGHPHLNLMFKTSYSNNCCFVPVLRHASNPVTYSCKFDPGPLK